MYTPQHYKNEDLSEVKAFIKGNSFGILVNTADGKPWATHIPLELEVDDNGNDILVGHMSRANPQWHRCKENPEVLCIFNGPHGYVSSSWYKEEDVPTWNYIAVHIYGTITLLDEDAVLASLHRLVDNYEQGSKAPVSLHDMSVKTMGQIKGIVGFKVVISDIQATYKLSQTRRHDHAKIIQKLEETQDFGAHGIAKAMKTHNGHLK